MGWCCHHAGKGCPTTPPALPFDCNAGFANWVAGWSEPKKVWCCHHAGKGCPTPPPTPYDCNAGFANWQAGWSVPKKSLVLPSCRQGLPAADDGGSPPRTLRLQRRVRELAGWVVGTQKKRGAASTVVRGARRRPARLLAEAFGFLDGVGDDVSKSWHWRARAIFWCQQGQDQKHGWLISHLRVRALPALP